MPRTPADAASWATTFQEPQPGLCDHFVGLAYGFPNSGFESANAHWDQTPKNLRHVGDTNPPVGALVYFNTGNYKYGHVAIVTGYRDGKPLVATTHANNGKPTTMPLDQMGMSYRGGATPYFRGEPIPVGDFTGASGQTAITGTADYEDMTGVGANGMLQPDPLSKRALAAEYEYSWKMMKQNPELMQLLMKSFNDPDGQWTSKKFALAIKDTKWYAKNADYTREALTAQAIGGADWKSQVQEATANVTAAAAQMGVPVTSMSDRQMKELADRYIFEGWGQPDRANVMKQELAKMIATTDGMYTGVAGTVEDSLKRIAINNGLTLDQSFYNTAAKQVATGAATLDDYERQVREQAASYWPTFSDQIIAGQDARNLASGYINTMARTLELDPNSIDLNDPSLRGAMTQIDEKTGKPKPVGLWDFEQGLRKRPEYMGTKQAEDKVVESGVGILTRMGFM
jgi:CHAP domain